MPEECDKCKGTGEVTKQQLDKYENEKTVITATKLHDDKYVCDWCDGEGYLEMCY